MKTVNIALNEELYNALVELSKHELRKPIAQIRFLVREARFDCGLSKQLESLTPHDDNHSSTEEIVASALSASSLPATTAIEEPPAPVEEQQETIAPPQSAPKKKLTRAEATAINFNRPDHPKFQPGWKSNKGYKWTKAQRERLSLVMQAKFAKLRAEKAEAKLNDYIKPKKGK